MPTVYPSKKLLAAKRLEGVIELNKLPPKTVILIETVAQVFAFTVQKSGKVWATGVGKRSFKRQTAEFVGSIDQNGMLFAGLVVKDLHLIFKLADGRFTTGCVHSASVKGVNYSYELWSN